MFTKLNILIKSNDMLLYPIQNYYLLGHDTFHHKTYIIPIYLLYLLGEKCQNIYIRSKHQNNIGNY